MNRKLNFFVFGVARSGTSAMANSLNAFDEVFCAIGSI